MGHQHFHHEPSHKNRPTFDERLRDYIDNDPQLTKAVAEDTALILPRDAQSGDNFGQASGGSSGGSSSSSSSSSSSTTNSSCDPALATCPTNSNSTTTIPVVLGVVIPVVFITVAMLVIWRVKKKRNRMEDAADKHASLDFGLGEVSRVDKRKKTAKRARPGGPEMMDLGAERQFRKDRGLSLDMGSIGSPYVLPEQLTGSRPSFHSMSRATPDADDPYGPVTLLRTESAEGSRPGSRNGSASASIWTSTSDRTGFGARSKLIEHPQAPAGARPQYGPGETPLLGSSPLASPLLSPALPAPALSVSRRPVGQSPTTNTLSPLDPRNPPPVELPADVIHAPVPTQPGGFDFDLPAAQQNPLPTFQFTDDSSDIPAAPLAQTPPVLAQTPPPRSSSRPMDSNEPKRESLPEFDDDYVTYADVLGIVQNDSPGVPEQQGLGQGLGVQGVDMGNNRLSTSLRPLPVFDPADVNPEDRANRIRSFYREYFDEKRGTMGGPEAGMEYYEDYNQEHFNGPTVWDAETGQFVVTGTNRPYAQPVTRRAMTPPPRAPPRYRNGSNGSSRMYGSGQYGSGRPRVHSSASAAVRGRPPKKKLPPPAPLNNLPTPHLLRDDSAIFHAADFAPPSTYKDRVAGRPESPMMDKRPYAPSLRPFTPLVSSFADLRAMPSPHDLRKSGTFTGLDFAPPPRINHDTASDAGSIRSGRSNSSKMHLHNIRAGAYRVSRLPQDMVGTKDDLATALRPTWDQRGPANRL